MKRGLNCLFQPMKFGVGCVCAGFLASATICSATVDTYENDVVFDYPFSPTTLPNIDATNFINNNTFTINFSVINSGLYTTASGALYEPRNVVNYTNNDAMTVNTGFQFDTVRNDNTHVMAGNFFNAGSVDVPNSFFTIYYNGLSLTAQGQCLVTATNVINSGVINVAQDGLTRITGQNLDLTRGTISQSGFGSFTGNGQSGVSGVSSAIGVNTNTSAANGWSPSDALTPTYAYSSAPVFLYLFGSTPYISVTQVNPTNVIVRAVFIENFGANVTNNVYFGANGIGGGFATVEWVGTYLDAATGLMLTNYLYLNNNYLLGASTNAAVVGGIPNNFTFASSTTPNASLGTLADSGFPDGFTFNPPSPDTVTNSYSYVDAELIASTTSIAPSQSNPSGALTNISGRIEITATKELNLGLSQIFGPNYLSITATNQFDGSEGATITSPYTDINLGVTNGSMTVSNLLTSTLPKWHGTVEAWSATWKYADTNTSTNTISYDYRVLLVSSALTPTTSAQVQDLILHATNSVVLSDAMNVMRTVSMDTKNLTLTKNGAGVGAQSVQGELNWQPTITFGPTQLPNLLWLTNSGAITLGNVGVFGSSPARYATFVNNGLITDSGTTIWTTNFVNSGSIFNGAGNFALQSYNTTLTNGYISATSDISISGSNLMAAGTYLMAGKSLTIATTNLLTDGGTNAGNYWYVGASSSVGLKLPVRPVTGDLLGTTVSILAGTNKNVVNTWAGQDRGASPGGYTNNAALGRLVLNSLKQPTFSLLTFNPASTSNALYVKTLELTNYAATLNFATSNATALAISPGMVIYYSEALSNGVSVASAINGWNNNRLRYASTVPVPTNIVVTTPTLTANGFQFTVSGVSIPGQSDLGTGAVYTVVIQSATNLAAPNWLDVYSGPPPFTYTNFGYTNGLQQFFRAKQGL